jgi:uncharacterized repeat protein (TIGR01451 family)
MTYNVVDTSRNSGRFHGGWGVARLRLVALLVMGLCLGFALAVSPALARPSSADARNDNNNAPTSSQDTVVLMVEADLTLDKTAAANIIAGEVLTYTLSVYNNGPSDAAGVVIVDTLPAGVTLTWADPSCVSAGQVVTCNISTLPNGGTAIRQIVISVDGDLEPGVSLENTAQVTANTPDSDPTNNQDTANTVILCQADLSLDKSGPATVLAGESITYTLVVNNAGPSTARAVNMHDNLPPGVTNISVEVVRSSGEPILCVSPICDLGDVAVGEVVTITLVGAVNPGLLPGTNLLNMASLTSSTPDDDITDNADEAETTVETEADLAVDKVDLSDPVEPGEGFLYQINVTNHGVSDAQDVVLVDTLGTGLTFSTASPGCTGQSGSPTITCTLDSLEADETTFFLIAVRAGEVPSGFMLVNEVTVASATPDRVPGNNTDVEYTTVQQQLGPSADLAIDKTVLPSQVAAGDFVTYILTVTNAGPLAATGVQLLELIPPDTEMVSISADNPDFGYEFCTLAGICYLGTVQPNSTIVTVVAILQVDPDCQAASLTNIASVSGDQPDDHPEDNMDSAVVGVTPQVVADLALDLDAPATVGTGGAITYTLTVWNLGPQDATGVLVTDTLPADVALIEADEACTLVGGQVSCSAPFLAAGHSITFNFQVTVNFGLEPGTSLENRAVVGSLAYDPDPSNNAATADTSIIGWTDLRLAMSGPMWLDPGDWVTFTIVVVNDGPDPAWLVEIEDYLPTGITLVSATIQRNGSLPASCNVPVCYVGDMAVGETITVTIVGQVGLDLAPGFGMTNEATASSKTPEYNLANNSDVLQLRVRFIELYLPLAVFNWQYLDEP